MARYKLLSQNQQTLQEIMKDEWLDDLFHKIL